MFFNKADELGIIIICQCRATVHIIERYFIATQCICKRIKDLVDIFIRHPWQFCPDLFQAVFKQFQMSFHRPTS